MNILRTIYINSKLRNLKCVNCGDKIKLPIIKDLPPQEDQEDDEGDNGCVRVPDMEEIMADSAPIEPRGVIGVRGEIYRKLSPEGNAERAELLARPEFATFIEKQLVRPSNSLAAAENLIINQLDYIDSVYHHEEDTRVFVGNVGDGYPPKGAGGQERFEFFWERKRASAFLGHSPNCYCHDCMKSYDFTPSRTPEQQLRFNLCCEEQKEITPASAEVFKITSAQLYRAAKDWGRLREKMSPTWVVKFHKEYQGPTNKESALNMLKIMIRENFKHGNLHFWESPEGLNLGHRGVCGYGGILCKACEKHLKRTIRLEKKPDKWANISSQELSETLKTSNKEDIK